MVVEAEQWFRGQSVEGVSLDDEGVAYVVTIHGQRAWLSPGDWVIKEPDGIHHYPCKPDIFEATYEKMSVRD